MTTLMGDCRDTLKTIASGTVQMCCTSPPYWGLRRYLPVGHPDAHREIGQEKTPAEYVETMVGVFREVRRVLHESGTVWLNVGDSYATSGTRTGNRDGISQAENGDNFRSWHGKRAEGLKEKDMCLIPERLLIALQDDGWWVRSKIVWAKKSCMPESVTDRPTNSWEPIFLLAKSANYFYDAFAVREKGVYEAGTRAAKGSASRSSEEGVNSRPEEYAEYSGYRNQRNVWHLGPEPFSDAHFATFPSAIPKRAIMAGTSERGCCPVCFAPWVRVVESKPAIVKSPASEYGNGAGRSDGNRSQLVGAESRTTGWRASCDHGEEPIPCIVIDPFLGSGTVAKVAQDIGRRWIGCELNPAYHTMIDQRTAQMGMIL
jgi:site-specific DNA-methyltransferase (cytosine-N4-specific)